MELQSKIPILVLIERKWLQYSSIKREHTSRSGNKSVFGFCGGQPSQGLSVEWIWLGGGEVRQK